MLKKKLKILVVGGGGREHAIIWKLTKSKRVAKIYCAPGNAGTATLAENVSIEAADIKNLIKFARKEKIDHTFIGSEAPLIAGITDRFRNNNLSVIGPTRKAARIEGSKVFAKKLMAKYGIPTARFRVFSDYEKAIHYLKKRTFPLVIKADGQCFGKGVSVAGNFKQAELFLNDLMIRKVFGNSGNKVIIEEYLKGMELSIMLITDGKDFVTLLPSQDHKPVFDNDRGPNTGGMGAYSPVPFVGKKLMRLIEKTIIAPTIKALRKENSSFQGILYPGLILTGNGPFVLEYNCRFGDPETQPVLSLLITDLADIFDAILNKKVSGLKISWEKKFSLCVILSSKGYPGKYQKGITVKLPEISESDTVNIFHSGTEKVNGTIVTSGGRVLGVTATGKTLQEAINNAYRQISMGKVYFKGMQYRRDIGRKGLN